MTNNERYPGNDIHDTAIIAEGVKIGVKNIIGPYCIIGNFAEWKGHEKSGSVIIGDGNVFTGLVTIDSGTLTNTFVGSGCYFMKHSHVGHDCKIISDVTLSCGAKVGGHTVIYKGANIGLNAVIHQKQAISEGCMIGMGSVVTRSLMTERYTTYAGNPAKRIGLNDKHPNYTVFVKQMI